MVETIETIAPFRDVLVVPIYAKPLRALPLQRQIGHVDTIAYRLSLRPPLVSVSDELWRMLNEALAVADVSDENIAPYSIELYEKGYMKDTTGIVQETIA